MTHRLCWAATVVMLSYASAAPGQIPREPDPTRVRLRIGPLWVNPSLVLSNAGVDTNVFNEPEADGPKRDFTVIVSPQTDLWLRMGRTWMMGNVKEEIVWYNKYASERSANNNYTVNWLVPLTRLSFIVGGNLVRTRERPGFEIDARPNRQEQAVNGAFEIRALSRTLFGARADVRKIEFDENAFFRETNLHNELTRKVTTASVTVRHELTPLTSFILDVGAEQERFDTSPLRDADSTQVNIGMRFDTFALINGFAQVGIRDYAPLSSDVPSYTGTVASVNLSYVALGSTRLGVILGRDIQHSFDINQPYYLQTGISGSVAQQIYGPVDLQARTGWQRLSYRERIRPTVAIADRLDHIRSYGGGIGYRLGRDLRVGFNVDQQKRESLVDDRRYDGVKYGVAVSYGQ